MTKALAQDDKKEGPGWQAGRLRMTKVWHKGEMDLAALGRSQEVLGSTGHRGSELARSEIELATNGIPSALRHSAREFSTIE
jgi:hypothetical protein